LNKLKILRVTDSYPPPWSGLGPGPYALSNAQAERGHFIHVVTKFRDGCKQVDKRSKAIIHRIKAKSFLFDTLAFIKLMKLDRKISFDLVHLHGTSFFPFYFLLKIFFNKPVFMSVHAIRKRQYQIYKTRKIARYGPREKIEIFGEGVCISSSDYFLPVSQGLKEELISLYGISDDLMMVVDNGVESFFLKDFNKEKLRQKLGITEFTLLFVGNLNGRKDIGDVILALKNLVGKQYNVKFIVVGSGPLKGHYLTITQKARLADNVTFIDELEQKKLVDYYRACDAFVLPSYYEGLPKVLIEAMACGLPIICSDIPGNNQLITDMVNGLLHPIEDVEALEQCIRYMVENRAEILKMGKRNRDIVRKQYTWKNVARNIDEAYRKLLC